MDRYYDQAELEEIDSGKMHGGAFFLPLLASALAPTIVKLITGKGSAQKVKKVQKHLVGSGLFKDLAKSLIKMVLKKGIEAAKGKALDLSQEYITKGADFASEKINGSGCDLEAGCAVVGGADKLKKPAAGKRKNFSSGCGSRQNRNILVKKVMKEHKLSLPLASKYIKEHRLAW